MLLRRLPHTFIHLTLNRSFPAPALGAFAPSYSRPMPTPPSDPRVVFGLSTFHYFQDVLVSCAQLALRKRRCSCGAGLLGPPSRCKGLVHTPALAPLEHCLGPPATATPRPRFWVFGHDPSVNHTGARSCLVGRKAYSSSSTSSNRADSLTSTAAAACRMAALGGRRQSAIWVGSRAGQQIGPPLRLQECGVEVSASHVKELRIRPWDILRIYLDGA